MKILITGSSGFVGKHLVKLLSKKHTIVKYDLVDDLNILDDEKLARKMKGVETVINLAAFISAPESWEKPFEYFLNNSLGALSVVKVAINLGVKNMIHFSSAAVKAKPLTPYGLSKKMSEQILDLYKKQINITIVRPENIYGNGQKSSYGYVIHSFINAVKNNLPVKIYGDGRQIRDFVYVDDVIAVVEKIVSDDIYDKKINIGLGKGISVIELAKLVSKLYDKKLKMEFLDKRIEPRKSVADTTTLREIGIDTKKFVSLKEGIMKLK